MIAKGYSFDVITDVGSGINYNKKGLNQVIGMITNSAVEKIVILYKDRLLRFGFEIIDNTEKKEEQELVDDLIQIGLAYGISKSADFSCRL